MPTDPAVQIALYALVGSIFTGISAIVMAALTFWNQQRLFKNQRTVAVQERAWDIADRKTRYEETKHAIGVVGKKADDAYDEANHTKEQIIQLHQENNAMHKDIGAVLEVAKAVKHATGEHKRLESAEIDAIANGVVKTLRATAPLSSGD